MSSTLMSIKAKNEARLSEEKRMLDRKRNVMVLILKHLHDEGYVDTANQLQQEAGVVLSKFHVADNMDLPFIVHQFEEYQEVKFSRRPVVVRKKGAEEAGEGRKPARVAGNGRRRPQRFDRDTPQKPPAAKPRRGASGRAEDAASSRGSRSERSAGGGRDTDDAVAPDGAPDLGAGQRVQGLASEQDTVGRIAARRKAAQPAQGAGAAEGDEGEGEEYYGERVVKALPFRNDPEMRKLAQSIARDIFTDNPNVRWSDVVELDAPKRILKEAVVMPVKYPQLFTGLLQPWNGVLLFGPPGTGKTMLAKAVATECETTFFNISASSIVSKWRGDSEKLVRCLFEMARHYAPSTIFLDEIDSIMSQRGSDGAGSEHEASRRMKTELLIQMDGLAKTDDLVFLLAASNLPWELDSALLRRLEKRVLVPLPPVKARQVMIEKMLPPKHTRDLAYEELAAKTEGYSGSDIALVCKEAAMRPLRRLMNKLELLEDGRGQEYADDEVKMDPVTTEDAVGALEVTRPSAHAHEAKYVEWQRAYGSV